jgi:hypothetical protein
VIRLAMMLAFGLGLVRLDIHSTNGVFHDWLPKSHSMPGAAETRPPAACIRMCKLHAG